MSKVFKMFTGLENLQCDTEAGIHLCLHIVKLLKCKIVKCPLDWNFQWKLCRGRWPLVSCFKLREIYTSYIHLVLTKIVKMSPGFDTLQCDTEGGGDHLCLHIVQRLSQLDLSL